ncbi:hypothetical protein HDU86_007703 [Geranomyces michiganensis]|nr:hypothetical protein HDU86_007703 [Geranomyces michiganensis]
MKRQASWSGRLRGAKKPATTTPTLTPARSPSLSTGESSANNGSLNPHSQPPTVVVVVTADQVRYHRLRAGHLVDSALRGPAGLTSLAAAHFGIQAQESTSAYVSLWQRLAHGAHESQPPTLEQFRDWFLDNNTGLIRIWGQRATLQMYDSADWPIVCAAVGEGVIANRIKSNRSGNVTGRDSSAELAAARKRVAAVLAQGESVAATDFIDWGFSPKLVYSVFMCATVEGQGARHDHGAGTVSLLKPRSVVVAPKAEASWRTWSTADALAEAARRYFKTYGPALEEDFRYYMGLSAKPSKETVAALLARGEISPVVVSSPTGTTTTTGKSKAKGGAYYIVSSSLDMLVQPVPEVDQWPPRLLYRFDPLLLAHADKSFWIPSEHKATTWTKNGMILPTVLVGGRVTGTWTLQISKLDNTMSFAVVALPGFPPYEGDVAAALARQARGLAGFMGGEDGHHLSPPRHTADGRPAASLLTKLSRSLELAVTNFSQVRTDQTFSYGTTPFLISSERKWGVNLYPFGLKPNSKDYGSRIDVYFYIWARDSHESEASFKEWIRSNKVKFTITITEPPPAALHVVASSQHCWCDMEDAAGWWKLSLKASPKILDLNQDTLIIRIAFDDIPDAASDASAPTEGGTEMLPLPASHGTANQGLPTGLFDNPHISDFTMWAGHASSEFRAVHLQQGVLEARLPRWGEFRAWSRSASPIVSNKHRPPLGGSSTVASASAPTPPADSQTSGGELHTGASSACIAGVPYEVTYAFLSHIYTNAPPIIDCSVRSYAYLHLLAEGFGLSWLIKACRRMVYALLTEADAVSMLLLFGGRSPGLEAVISSWVVQHWADVRPTKAFRRLYEHPTRNGTARLLAVLRRVKTAATPLSSPVITEDRKSDIAMHCVDGPRCVAFATLLDNPAASDVHFIVEGRRITAQKSVLMSLSEYFAAMFSSGFAETVTDSGDKMSSPTVINIPDFSYGTIHNLLLFLYTGRLDPPRTATAMGDLFIVGDKYQVHELSDLAHAMLRREMRSDGVAQFLFRYAKYPALRDLVLEILVRDFDAVKRTEGFAAALTEQFDECYDWSSLVETIIDRLCVTGLNTAQDSSVGSDSSNNYNDEDDDLRRFDWDKLADEGGLSEADAREMSAMEVGGGTVDADDDDEDDDDDDDDDENEIYKDAHAHLVSETTSSCTGMTARDSDAESPGVKRHVSFDDELMLIPDPPEASQQSPRRAAG